MVRINWNLLLVNNEQVNKVKKKTLFIIKMRMKKKKLRGCLVVRTNKDQKKRLILNLNCQCRFCC